MHDAALADGEAGDGVAAAANRYGKRSADAALEGAHDVGDAGAACDDRGAAVDHTVEDRSGCVVVWRCGVQGLAAHGRLKVFEICRGDARLVWLCHVRYLFPFFFLCEFETPGTGTHLSDETWRSVAPGVFRLQPPAEAANGVPSAATLMPPPDVFRMSRRPLTHSA